MFSRFKQLVSSSSQPFPGAREKERRATYASFLGEPELVFRDKDDAAPVIEAYRRDFRSEGGRDGGYALLTNGMSDRRMTIPGTVWDINVKPCTELIWHVPEPTLEAVECLRWLSEFPFHNESFIGFGSTVTHPALPLPGCTFSTFLMLTPIIRADQSLAKALESDRQRADLLTVNLVSEAEEAFIKREGLDRFLDILDEREYPVIFNPARRSYV